MNLIPNVKPLTISILALSVAFTSGSVFAHSGHKHEEGPTISIPEVVAKVNETNITRETIAQQLKKAIANYKKRGMPLTPDQEKTATKKLINDEIDRTLLLQKGTELGIEVSHDQVSARIDEVKSQFESDTVFGHTLASEGITLKQYAAQLRDDLILEKVIGKEVEPGITVTDEEIKNYYETNKSRFTSLPQRRASVLLIRIPKNSGSAGEASALKKIKSIQEQIKNGSDFADLTKRFSNDSLASKGGDLGYFNRKQMFAPFSSRAFEMKVGEVSDVFKTAHGFHLLKVTDAKEGGNQSLEEVRESIKASIKQSKTNQATQGYLESLKKKADIQIYF